MNKKEFPLFEGELIYNPSVSKQGKGYLYFIFNQLDELIYIGQTTNLFSRFGSHVSCKTTKYTMKYVTSPIESLSEVEAEFILFFNPQNNSSIPANNRWLTIPTFIRKYLILKGKTVK